MYLDPILAGQEHPIITDPETGEPIKGLGGKTWRSDAGEHDSFRVIAENPVRRIHDPDFTAFSLQLRKVRDDLFIRTPKKQKRLRPIPERYHGLF